MLKLLKWGGALFVIFIFIGLAYLAVHPDPGPYLVALRSDTPEQVAKALDALAGDTRVYNGTYPTVTIEDLRVLGRRYYRKATGQSQEPLIGDTAAWMGFAGRVVTLIQSESQNKPSEAGNQKSE